MVILVAGLKGGWELGQLLFPPPPPPQPTLPAPTFIFHEVSVDHSDSEVATIIYGPPPHTPSQLSIAHIINSYSTLHSLDPHLLARLIHVESRGRPSATGPRVRVQVHGQEIYTRAVGLGQIIPELWLGVYPECGTSLHNPRTNICYTTYILRHFISRYPRLDDALLAYNGCSPGWSCDWYAPEILGY